MNITKRTRHLFATLCALALIGLLPAGEAGAELADISPVPLANSPSDAVLPNLMYILDDSGSMAWSYMPDQIVSGPSDSYRNCKACSSGTCKGPGGTGSNGDQCASSQTAVSGEAPFNAPVFNKIWYNPNITYSPGVDGNGVSLGNADPKNASNDFYSNGTKLNLVTSFPEMLYCTKSSPSAAEQVNTAICRKNGIHNVSPFLVGQPTYFLYWGSAGTNAGLPTTVYPQKVQVNNSNPHYYNMVAHEYCKTETLVDCALAKADGTAPDTTNTVPAPLRWCKTAADAILTTVVTGLTGTAPKCQKKFNKTNYPYPRFGRMTRVDIIPAVTSYAKGAASVRTDCAAAANCSYAEELQNFANWYAYYRTRMSMMKTATGRAFVPIDDRFRIGFITINPGSGGTFAKKYQKIDKFETVQKNAFYTKLYDQDPSGSTPLRTALQRVGRHYQGLTDGINADMKEDPLQYSCQQNYALVTTDGYWNDPTAPTGIGDQDNSLSDPYTKRALGTYDGALGAKDTLADVAHFYYKTDLRTGATNALAVNNVPTTSKDTNNQQHMVTFTLGLGLEGNLDYKSDYETSLSGDFAKIKEGGTNTCSWTTGVCNWPIPVANDPSALDDLWHAAVNGRGKYFSASDPNTLTQGLQSALAELNTMTAAASASATSSPNITETDNYIYSSTFRTVKWDGEIIANRIDPSSGNVLPAVVWAAQALLDARTTATSDSRTIYTIDDAGTGKKKAFTWATLSSAPVGGIAAEQGYFGSKCTVLSQCAMLTMAQKALANDGNQLVNYLRGWRGNETFVAPESTSVFRTREHVLGDPVNATPAFMSSPKFNFADAVTPTYADFQAANLTRQPTLFIAANDGMLHALNGDTGQEMWAYVPRIVMPKLHKLATANWASTHDYSVDGSPQLMDAFFGGAWKTVVVAGLGGGGRGYYALDVTNPASPNVLWEICSDATLCKINDPDIGFSYGNPVVTKRASDGKWVVIFTSGLNNVSPGTGRGYLFVADLATGTILNKVDTGAGTLATPAGLDRISAFAENFVFDNTAKYVYGGDLYGNVWKFDMTAASPTILQLATLKDAGGKPQSITTRPELAIIEGFPVVFVGTGRYLGIDDLSDPATLSPPNTWAYRQSMYGIKDRGIAYGNFRSGNVVQQTITDTGGISRSNSNNPVDWTVKDGWYMDFNPGNSSPGERVNIDPQLVQGTLVVVTNVPNNNACTVGGDSWVYQFDYKTGSNPKSTTGLAGAGGTSGQKFTGKITVGLVIVRLPSGIFKGIATGATGDKTVLQVNTGGGGGSARRVSWRELFQR
jgi:type IV pilus assembly protein PilY1